MMHIKSDLRFTSLSFLFRICLFNRDYTFVIVAQSIEIYRKLSRIPGVPSTNRLIKYFLAQTTQCLV